MNMNYSPKLYKYTVICTLCNNDVKNSAIFFNQNAISPIYVLVFTANEWFLMFVVLPFN